MAALECDHTVWRLCACSTSRRKSGHQTRRHTCAVDTTNGHITWHEEIQDTNRYKTRTDTRHKQIQDTTHTHTTRMATLECDCYEKMQDTHNACIWYVKDTQTQQKTIMTTCLIASLEMFWRARRTHPCFLPLVSVGSVSLMYPISSRDVFCDTKQIDLGCKQNEIRLTFSKRIEILPWSSGCGSNRYRSSPCGSNAHMWLTPPDFCTQSNYNTHWMTREYWPTCTGQMT